MEVNFFTSPVIQTRRVKSLMLPARLLSKKEHGKFEIILIKNSVLLEPTLKKDKPNQ